MAEFGAILTGFSYHQIDRRNQSRTTLRARGQHRSDRPGLSIHPRNDPPRTMLISAALH